MVNQELVVCGGNKEPAAWERRGDQKGIVILCEI
jgi:hypothetical protein